MKKKMQHELEPELCIWWTPDPVIVAVTDNKEYIGILLPSCGSR